MCVHVRVCMSCFCICFRVYAAVYTYIYLKVQVCTYICICTYKDIYIYIHTHTYTHIYVLITCINMYTYTYAYVSVYIYLCCIYTYLCCICTYMYIYACVSSVSTRFLARAVVPMARRPGTTAFFRDAAPANNQSQNGDAVVGRYLRSCRATEGRGTGLSSREHHAGGGTNKQGVGRGMQLQGGEDP